MLLSMVLKYFIYNHKRTFQAILVVSVGTMLFVASVGIMNGFSTQTELLGALIPSSPEITIKPSMGEVITDQQVQEIDHFLVKYELSHVKILKMNISTVTVLSVNGKLFCKLILIDTSLFDEYFGLNYPNGTSVVAVGKSLASFMGITSGDLISFYSDTGVSYEFKQVNNILRNPSWVLNYLFYAYNFTMPGKEYSFNQIKLKFASSKEAGKYASLMTEELNGLKIEQKSGAEKYFVATFDEVLRVLWVFELAFGVLAILSVGYTFYTLVKESEYEIMIFKSLGFSKAQIFFLYYGQIILSGLFGGFTGVIIGLLGANGAIAMAAGIFGVPYFLSSISMTLFWQIILFSISISLVAGIYPGLVAAYQREAGVIR